MLAYQPPRSTQSGHEATQLKCSGMRADYYRQDAAKRQTAGNKFTQAKNQLFRSQGRLVAPIHVKFGTTNEHVGPLGHTKFHANRFTEVGTRPQNIKNFHFLVKSRLAGANPLTEF